MDDPGGRMSSAAGSICVPFEGGQLRPWLATDSPQLVAAWRDPEIVRWNPVPAEPTAATAEQWIAGWQQRYERGLAVDLAITEEPQSRVVGEVGLSSFADIPGGGRGALVGYWLLAEARGKGVAARAVAACVAWSRAELGLTVIGARCHADNSASQVVAARAGFVHERDDGSGNQLWFGRPRGR